MSSTIETRLAEFQQEFEPNLERFFEQKISNTQTVEEKIIWEQMRDYTLAGGKRIRPFLLWQMLENTRDEIRGLFDILVGFELLHNSTLIEDDIIDQHSTRRNKPTLPISLHTESINGEHITLIAAGLMRCASLHLIQHAKVSDKFKQECLAAYNEITTAINEGQALDLFWTKKLDIKESDLLLQTKKVAARFIEYMFRLGAGDSEKKDLWAEIGLHLGVILQLVDDLMDIDKNKNKGRAVGDDIRLGKTTPLIISCYNNLTTEDRQCFEQNFGNPQIDDEELNWMIRVCETTGAISHVKGLIKDRLANVNTILSSTGVDNEHWIHELKKFSVERVN